MLLVSGNGAACSARVTYDPIGGVLICKADGRTKPQKAKGVQRLHCTPKHSYQLGRVDEHIVKRLVALLLVLVCLLLALDAERSPRYSGDALGADLFLAVQADSKRSVVNATKSRSHVA